MKAKKKASVQRDPVFVMRQTSVKGKRTWWSSVYSQAPLLVRVGITVWMVLLTASRALTYWSHIVTEYQENATLAVKPIYYLVMCVLALVSLYLLAKPDGKEVRKTDAEEQPDEALLWEWCDPCGMLRPPDASHCSWCQKCIKKRYFHTLCEFQCISASNVKASLCWFLTDFLLQYNTLSTTSVRELVILLYNFIGVLRALWAFFSLTQISILTQAATPKERSYSKTIYNISRSSSECSSEMQPEFSFSAQKGGVCAQFCPTEEGDGSCAATQRRTLTRCPRPGCNNICNNFWVTGDEDGIVECNICQAAFALPEDEVRKAELESLDEEWLVAEGLQKPMLVFILDSPAAEDCRALIDKWVRDEQPKMDIDVVTPGEGLARKYWQDKFTQERYTDDIHGYMNMDNILALVSQDLTCRGGRLVFVRESSFPLAHTTLVALGRATRSVPLEYVSLTRVSEASLSSDLNPGFLQQIQQGGGTFWRLYSHTSLAWFLRRRELIPWGVLGSVRVILSPGLHVASVSGPGVNHIVRDKDTRFNVATLSESTPVSLEVRVDAEAVKATRRLTDPHDSRVFVQLQLTYTRLDGCVMRRVYNRAFEAAVGEDRVTLTPLP